MTLCSDSKGFDKMLHFLMGALICLVTGGLMAYLPPHIPWVAVAVAMAAVVAIAAIKELRDARRPGNHFCLWDFLWTVAGGFAFTWLPWLTARLLAING